MENTRHQKNGIVWSKVYCTFIFVIFSKKQNFLSPSIYEKLFYFPKCCFNAAVNLDFEFTDFRSGTH